MNQEFFVHPKGLCESETVGAGTRIWAFAHVLSGARIGTDCNICDAAFIEGEVVVGDRVTIKNRVQLFDGVTIGDDVFIGPGAVFTNDPNPRSKLREGSDHLLNTTVGEGATIGANATILPGLSIGDRAMVGAGSVVASDVPAHSLVYGSPARHAGWVCTCGHRLDDNLQCGSCPHRFVVFKDSIVLSDS